MLTLRKSEVYKFMNWHGVSKDNSLLSHLHEQEASEEIGRQQIHILTIQCHWAIHPTLCLSSRGRSSHTQSDPFPFHLMPVVLLLCATIRGFSFFSDFSIGTGI